VKKEAPDRKREHKRPRALQYTYTFVVPRSDTLLAFLLRKLPGMSRNSVKALLHDHKTVVNGRVVTQFDYPLAKDDEVKIARSPVHDQPQKIAQVAHTDRGEGNVRFKSLILYEDDAFLAIDKPAGMLAVESDTVRYSAYYRAAEYLRTRDSRSRPYILHRIDKETSGVLVFAKDIKVHSMLRMHWNEDVSLREYYAVVEGQMEKKSGTLVYWLRENANGLVYVSKDRSGKKAVTHYEVVREKEGYSLLRITIDSGRKNQIRVSLKESGHPVAGDDKYPGETNPLNRLCLHASELDFLDPRTRRTLRIRAPLPKEFERFFQL
jgi:23S rRNA pseudouridine1911/1915/1917 synthase